MIKMAMAYGLFDDVDARVVGYGHFDRLPGRAFERRLSRFDARPSAEDCRAYRLSSAASR